jgi:hypothetical protein
VPRPKPVKSDGDEHQGPSLHKRSPPKEVFLHQGFTADLRLGTQGCFRTICSESRHNTSPGFRLDGFVGGNIAGWFEIGASAGFGTLRSNVPEGTNALALYGIDAAALQAAAERLNSPLAVTLSSLAVTDSKLRTARAGPHFRIHFIPRGRVATWIGSGVGYSLFRAKYQTRGGDLRFDLHGIDIPVEAGLAVFVHENVAVTAQFDFLWAWYALATFDHPDQAATLPVKVLEAALSTEDANLRRELPLLWTLGFGVRARI